MHLNGTLIACLLNNKNFISSWMKGDEWRGS
nr:MAG TPA: hypothetical protein [Caudoviricetes sp.]